MTQPLWFLGIHFNILADAATTGGKYDSIEGYFPSGIQTPPHRHTRYSEQVYVLEGEITVWAGADKHVLHPGESFLISFAKRPLCGIGTPHVVGSVSDKAARLLCVASPSSFARLIEETGTLEHPARSFGSGGVRAKSMLHTPIQQRRIKTHKCVINSVHLLNCSYQQR